MCRIAPNAGICRCAFSTSLTSAVDHAVERAGPRSGLLTLGNKSGARWHRTWASSLFRGGHGGSPVRRQAAAGASRLQRLRAAMSASQPAIKAICSPPKRHITAMETATGTGPMVELPGEAKAEVAAGHAPRTPEGDSKDAGWP
jgi:hypothetical protein